MNKKIIFILLLSIAILVVTILMEFINGYFFFSHLFFLFWLILLLFIYIIINKKKSIIQRRHPVKHIIKTLLACYMIAIIFWGLLIEIGVLLDAPALIDFVSSKFLLIVFVVMVFSYPIVVRRLQ